MGDLAVTSAALPVLGELVRRRAATIACLAFWALVVVLCAASWGLTVLIAYAIVR